MSSQGYVNVAWGECYAPEYGLPLSGAGTDMGLSKVVIFSAAIVLNQAWVDAGEPAVRVRVSSQPLMAPADLLIYVTVEKSADNRLLRVTAESDDFFRASEVALAGEESARITILHFRELPQGSYDVKADVVGANGRRRGLAHCFVTVL